MPKPLTVAELQERARRSNSNNAKSPIQKAGERLSAKASIPAPPARRAKPRATIEDPVVPMEPTEAPSAAPETWAAPVSEMEEGAKLEHTPTQAPAPEAPSAEPDVEHRASVDLAVAKTTAGRAEMPRLDAIRDNVSVIPALQVPTSQDSPQFDPLFAGEIVNGCPVPRRGKPGLLNSRGDKTKTISFALSTELTTEFNQVIFAEMQRTGGSVLVQRMFDAAFALVPMDIGEILKWVGESGEPPVQTSSTTTQIRISVHERVGSAVFLARTSPTAPRFHQVDVWRRAVEEYIALYRATFG